MPLVMLGLRALLSAVFVVAAVGKFLDRPGARRAFVEFGVPEALTPPLAILLPLAEFLVALLLLLPATAWLGALGALGLLAVFIAGIAYNLARGRHPDCHCFGQIYSAPAGPSTLVRNGLLAAATVPLLVFGITDPGPGPLDWASGMSAGELAALGVGLGGLAAAAVLAWFTLQLAASVGRLQLALDELRDRSVAPGTSRTPPVPPTGLPIGRAAPSFELDGLDGAKANLAALLQDTRMLMLAFIDPDCAPCRDLLPDLARWQRRDDLAVVPISRGTASANRRELRQHRLSGVLLQRDSEVANSFEVKGTPSAVLIAPDGRMASAVAAGADAIRELAARAPRVREAPTTVATSVPGSSTSHVAPAGLNIGAHVPDIELRDLDGEPVTVARSGGRETLILFWRPSCGFCARIVPDVKAWAASAKIGRTDLVLVALDDRDANAALDLGATIVLDPDMKAFGAFGANGTPVAVKVDRRGRVASPLAIGTEQVRGLARAAGLGPAA